MDITFNANEQGRISLPMGVAGLGWESHTPLEIWVENEQVIISTCQPSCKICGGTQAFVPLVKLEINICEGCYTAILEAKDNAVYF